MEDMETLTRQNRVLKLHRWDLAVLYASSICYANNGSLGFAEVSVDYRGAKSKGKTFPKLENISDMSLVRMAGQPDFLVEDIPPNSWQAQREYVVNAVRKRVTAALKVFREEGLINYVVR